MHGVDVVAAPRRHEERTSSLTFHSSHICLYVCTSLNFHQISMFCLSLKYSSLFCIFAYIWPISAVKLQFHISLLQYYIRL